MKILQPVVFYTVLNISAHYKYFTHFNDNAYIIKNMTSPKMSSLLYIITVLHYSTFETPLLMRHKHIPDPTSYIHIFLISVNNRLNAILSICLSVCMKS